MQPVSTALFNVLEQGINSNPADPLRDLTYLIEFYEYDVLPDPVTGHFDPANAAQLFAPIEITWSGQAYRRASIAPPDIKVIKGARANSTTIRLSNADENRYFATWVNSTQIAGMRVVIRIISQSASASVTDSAVRFVGKCETPEGFDVIQGSIAAAAEFGSADFEWPPRTYTVDDPEGRSPADPLFEGFSEFAISGSFVSRRAEPDRRLKGDARFFETRPYSSFDDTQLGEPIPLILGRSQIAMNRGIYVDMGRQTNVIDFICQGEIEGILNFRMDNTPDYQQYFTQPENITVHYGKPGALNLSPAIFPSIAKYYSGVAYVDYDFRYIGTGSFTNIDAGHQTIAVVLGLKVKLPDSSGVFNSVGWTDNGAYLTRHLLTDPRFFNINEAFIEDSACWATGQYNDLPVFDTSNSEQIYVPTPDLVAAGTDFRRFRSTGLINTQRARHVLGIDTTLLPEEREAEDFDGFDPSAPPTLIADVTRVRKNFTTNCILKQRKKGQDFLFGTVMGSYRGYLAYNWRGKIEPRSERPADFAHLRAATVAPATTILIEDVTSWKATNGLWGWVVVGAHRTTSEARKPLAAAFTTDANGISLAAAKTGTLIVGVSGAQLAGGTASAPATGTIVLGGTAQAGAQVQATIGGNSVTYTLEADDTLETAAYMLAACVNAHTQLRRFVSAAASGVNVTITSKWGVLTLSSALANAHAAPAANPTSTPTPSASGGGTSLAAGTYRLAYANRTAAGSTYISPYVSITITAGQGINVPTLALPAGVTSRDWFLSKAPGDSEMVLYTNASGAPFTITAPPDSTAAFPPEYNTSGEECIRVAMPFASNNQTPAILAQSGLTRGNIFDNTFRGGMSGGQPTYTQIKGVYVNAGLDFAPSPIELNDKAQLARLGKPNPKELDLTGVDNFHQARRLAYFNFSKFLDHHSFAQWKSNGVALLLEENDVVPVCDDSGGFVNGLVQLEEFTIHLSDYTVSIQKARQYSTRMFWELVPKTRPVMASVLRWTATLPTELQILDLPHFREPDAALGAGFHIATWREDGTGDWRGHGVWVDAGDGYKHVADWDVEALGGEAVDVASFGTAPYGRSGTYTLRVQMRAGAELSSYTEDEFRAGAGLYRLGGEIFQARLATLVGGTTDTYDLLDIIRGRFGTEGETAGHTVGEEFTVLDSRVLFIPFDARHAGRELKVKVPTVNEDLADAVEHTFTWEARARQPLAPARVDTDETTQKAPRDSAGSVLITVHPRSNFEEIGEEYLAEFLSDDGLTVEGSVSFREGVATRAVLESSGANKYTSITANSLSDTGILSVSARSLQLVRRPENFVEATLVLDDPTATAGIGFMAAGGPWPSDVFTSADYFCHLRNDTAVTGLYQLRVRIGVGAGLVSYSFSAAASDATQRVRVEFVHGEIRFYRNWQGEASAPFHVAAVTPPFPLRAVAYVNGGGVGAHVDDMVVTTNPYPTTVLTDAQQIAYYGGLKNPVRTRIRQHSGVREVGYGFAFEELI